MNISVNNKSPLKVMFSSVFKREDIKLIREPFANANRSEASLGCKSRDFTPVKVVSKPIEAQASSRFLTPNRIPQKLQKSELESLISEENREKVSPCRQAENFKDLRYEELLKKYDRMQEFYKSQVANLTDEVEHYKSLYQKLVKYKNVGNF